MPTRITINNVEQKFNINQRARTASIKLRISYKRSIEERGHPIEIDKVEDLQIEVNYRGVKPRDLYSPIITDEETGEELDVFETITGENHIEIWPFYYDAFIDSGIWGHKLKITLILYRGVIFEDAGVAASLNEVVDLRIIRVQDIRQIPAFGTPIEHKNLFPEFNAVDLLEKYYDEDKSEEAIDRAKEDALENIIVQHVENGVRFQWLWTNQVLEIQIKNPKDARSGFSFSVNPEANIFPRISKELMDLRSSIKAEDFYNQADYGDALAEFDKRNNIEIAPTKPIYHDLLHIKICGEVEEETSTLELLKEKFEGPVAEWFLSKSGPPTLELKKSHLPQPLIDPKTIPRKGRFQPEVNVLTKQENLRFYTIEKVNKLDELPVAGERFKCKAHDKKLKIEETGFKYEQIAIDFVLGSIPILGDLIDIGDFLLALTTNRDKYGDKVTTGDKILMGVGALIPLVSSSTVKNLLKSSD